MLSRLTITLDASERAALQKAAGSDLRDIRDQARYILRRELAKSGFLGVDPGDSSVRKAVITNEGSDQYASR